MRDILNRRVEFGDAYNADDVVITFSGFNVGLLLSQVQIQYQQPVNRVYDLTSSKTAFVLGRTEGTFSGAGLSGPPAPLRAFLRTYGDACNMATNTIGMSSAGGWCRSPGHGSSYQLNHVLLAGLSLGMVSDTMMVTQQIQGQYLALTD